MKSVTILLSGGLDSATILALALSKGYSVSALAFDYKQNHKLELDRARDLCLFYNIPLDIYHIPYVFGVSSLISGLDIPLDRQIEEIAEEIPCTFVPGRNAVFLSLAASYSLARGIHTIAIGVNKTDVTGYPDCRPTFIRAFQEGLNAGLDEPMEILTPLLTKTKAEIVELAMSLEVPVEHTSSCYSPLGKSSCLRCDACKIRSNAFEAVGAVDNVL
jgi:7-cyano-7-deazaguanine synthase